MSKEHDAEARMTFTEHLAELRTRIIRVGVVVLVLCILCVVFSETIYHVVMRPLDIVAGGEAPIEKMTLTPFEWFIAVRLKLAGIAGLLLAVPYILYEACAFIFPGLRPKEKRLAMILLAGCSLLAIAGGTMAYLGVFPYVLPYVMSWTPDDVTAKLQVAPTLNVLLRGYLAFAVAFQFPMAVLSLVYMDLLSPATLRQYRRVAIIIMALASAMFTPPDVFTMVVMLLPLALLYEISIWLSYLVVRRRKRAHEQR